MKKPNHNLFTQFNPISAIDGNIVKNKGNDVALVYKLNMPEIFTLGEDEFDQIHSDFLQMLQFFQSPENVVIHKKDIFIKKKFDASILSDKTFLSKSVKNKFSERYYMDHQSFITFICPNVTSISRNYNKVQILKKIDNSSIVRNIEDFVSNVRQAVSVINSTNLIRLKPASSEEIIQNLYNEFTLFENKVGDLSFEPEFKIGENYVSLYSFSNDGQQNNSFFSNSILDDTKKTDNSKFFRSRPCALGLELDINHVYNQYIFIDDQKKVKSQLESNLKRLNGSSLISRKNKTASSINEEFLQGIEEENIKVVRLHTNVMFWAKDKEELNNYKDQVSSAYAKLDIIPNINSRYEYPYIYLANLLGNGAMLPKEETLMTYLNHSLCHFLFETNYKSDKSGILFNDRLSNCPIFVDVFNEPYKNKEINNRNYIIIAPTGGGKSFLMRNKIRSQIENPNNKTVVLNIGGDDKMARAYPNDSLYIEYKENEPININPFWLWENTITTSKIEFLIDFITLLWKAGDDINNDERSSLEKIILEFYGISESATINENDERVFTINKQNQTSLSNFFHFLEEQRDQLYLLTKNLINIDSLTTNLEKFVKGTFDNLFTSGEPIKFEDKKYVEFELDKIKSHPILFPIFSSVITDLIFNTMWKIDGTEKDFIADEAWVYLEKAGMGQVFKYLYKTIRKFDGSVGMAVQQITDLSVLKPYDEKAILENIAIKYLLDHREALGSIPDLMQKLSLSEADKSLLLSIEKKKDKDDIDKDKPLYREFLLKMGSKLSRILRLETSQECAILYESDKNKLGQFNNIYYNEANKDIEKTIKKMMTNN